MTTGVQIPRTHVRTQDRGHAPTILWGDGDIRTLACASLWSSQIYELQVQEDFISKIKVESEKRYWPLTSKRSYWHWPLIFKYSWTAVNIYMCSHSCPLLPSPNTLCKFAYIVFSDYLKHQFLPSSLGWGWGWGWAGRAQEQLGIPGVGINHLLFCQIMAHFPHFISQILQHISLENGMLVTERWLSG